VEVNAGACAAGLCRKVRIVRLDRFYLFFLDAERFRGTLPPSRRACERPIAIACFRLVTFFPDLPLRSVPRFLSRIAFSTFWDAFLPYFAIEPPRESRRQ
jgi:hypothetical protein